MSKPEFIEREHPGQNWTISTERPLRSIAKIKQALIAFLGRYSEEEFSDFTFLNKIAKEFPGTVNFLK